MQKSTENQVLNVKDLTLNNCNEINISRFNINAFHHSNDPETANRIKITNGLVEIEMLPSKGFFTKPGVDQWQTIILGSSNGPTPKRSTFGLMKFVYTLNPRQ